MSLSVPSRARTHDENRAKVCQMCWLKAPGTGEPMSATDIQRVLKFHFPRYDINNQKLAKSLCSSCKKVLSNAALGRLDPKKVPKHPQNCPPLEFNGLTGRQLKDLVCEPGKCTICTIARDNPALMGNTAAVKTPRAPSSTSSSKPGTSSTCDKCGQKVGRGIRHPCNITAKRRSADKLLADDQRGREQLACNVIKEKIAENPTAKNIGLQTRGGAKVMSIPNPKAQSKSKAPYADQPIPAAKFRDVATGIGLSNNQADQLGTSLRSLKGRDIIEPNAMPQIREMDRSLDIIMRLRK